MNNSKESDKKVHKIGTEKNEAKSFDNFLTSDEMESKVKFDYSRKKITETDEIYNNLLNIREVIRDPVHGDVGITLLEKNLIDLEIFQRMRGISQLGPTQLVFPGAVHNRFIHSIGTLHVAEKLVDICNQNYVYNSTNEIMGKYILKINPYQHLLIRLSALLHDIAHIPFGHTFEDEGNLFPPEWEDKKRSYVFKKGQPIYERISTVLEKFEIPKENKIAGNICQDLSDVLIKEEFRNPFVVDIVSGTLCADLLDYTQRDMLFCGLSERWGDRFIKYFAILSVEKHEFKKEEKKYESKLNRDDVYKLKTTAEGGKGRLILLAYRFEQDAEKPLSTSPKQKMVVLSEAIDLLAKRYSLSEKVYFHRTKLAASSMLISAIASAKLNNEELFDMMSEQELFVKLLSTSGRPLNLIKSYIRRNLYKPIYEICYKKYDETDVQARKLWDELYPNYRDPNNRLNGEMALEKWAGLEPGSVSIFCPDRNMNLKKFEALVHPRPDSDIKFLRYILDSSRRYEMSVIENKFELLWKFQVFVDPEKVNPANEFDSSAIELSKACEDLFGFSNEIGKFKLKITPEELILDSLIKRWDDDNPTMLMPQKIAEEIKMSSRRRPTEMPLEDYCRELIKTKVTSWYASREKL